MALFSLPLIGFDGSAGMLHYCAEVDADRAFHRELNKRILYAFDQSRADNNLTHVEDAMAVTLDAPQFDMYQNSVDLHEAIKNLPLTPVEKTSKQLEQVIESQT